MPQEISTLTNEILFLYLQTMQIIKRSQLTNHCVRQTSIANNFYESKYSLGLLLHVRILNISTYIAM
jgi:hypothetical protein